eukprot:1145751-Pelagomonas_calceolata.AAC.2
MELHPAAAHGRSYQGRAATMDDSFASDDHGLGEEMALMGAADDEEETRPQLQAVHTPQGPPRESESGLLQTALDPVPPPSSSAPHEAEKVAPAEAGAQSHSPPPASPPPEPAEEPVQAKPDSRPASPLPEPAED